MVWVAEKHRINYITVKISINCQLPQLEFVWENLEIFMNKTTNRIFQGIIVEIIYQI